MFLINVNIENYSNTEKECKVKINIKFLKDCITNVSKDIIQSKKKQDILPEYQIIDNALSIIVGDGHGGTETKNKIDDNLNNILTEIQSKNTLQAMIFCQELTSKCYDGAVISLSKLYFDNDHLVLDWTSRGDITLLIYQDQKLIHTNLFHKLDDNPNNNIVNETFLKNIDCDIREEDQYDFQINLEGTQIMSPVGSKRKYYCFHGDNDIACYGHIGHFNSSKKVPSYHKNYYLDKNSTYKFVICSDGVFDVFNPEDKFLMTHKAKEICQESQKRWLKSWYLYDTRPSSNGKIYGPDKYLSSDPDDCSCVTFEYNPCS